MKFEIIISEPFKSKLKKLTKKYPNIKNDLKEALENLEEGILLGEAIPGLFNKVFKLRLESSDMKRGKRGGFRLIHFVDENNKKIFLLTIYAKAKTENIPVKSILLLLKELELKR